MTMGASTRRNQRQPLGGGGESRLRAALPSLFMAIVLGLLGNLFSRGMQLGDLQIMIVAGVAAALALASFWMSWWQTG